MKGIFEIVCLVSLVFQRLVSSAPVKKATPTKSPKVIHCDLHNNIRQVINHLPYATGSLDQKVYQRYQRLVSVDEKKYLHKHLHSSTFRWSNYPPSGNQVQLLPGPLQSNLTVPLLLRNISSVISCSFCSLRKSKDEYRRLPKSAKVVKTVDDIQNGIKDLLSEIILVGKAIKPGSTYTTTCMTCQINLTKGKRSRQQIALDLAIALERLHAELIRMKVNFSALSKASCLPDPVVVSQSG